MGQTIFNCGLGLLGAAFLLLLIFAFRRLKYDASKMAADDDDELQVTIPGQDETVTLSKAPKPVKVLREGIDYEDDEDWDEDDVDGGDAADGWAVDDGDDAAAAPDVPEQLHEPAETPAEPAAAVETAAAPEEETSTDSGAQAEPENAQEETDSTAQAGADAAAHDDTVAEPAETVAEADNSGENAPDEKEGVVSE